ncbi:ABC transporter permease subunit [Actibacterium sp. MT2.3-13A]|uniref:ABC transporter permease n=1 Tax=Actibacterium sp. MT2.3-13A TaxID=2828332 RepID=UPI001BACE3C4|nr:ABC transporter permease subunit [Actibacterium sp. MT2.3-13A]
MTRSLKSRLSTWAVWLFLAVVLGFLYLPLFPPAIHSLQGPAVQEGGIWANYRAIADDPILVGGIWNTLLIGVLVALVTPLLSLLIAQALRAWKKPRLILGLVLLPLFIPGVSMGVATALFFRILGVDPSLLTMAMVQVLWALPFSTLVILTVMANFDDVYLEAAHMLGANRLQAFFEIELPQVYQGILGGGIFALILSFNETIRTSIVQGGENTVQTYLWSQYQQIGLNPTLFALMTLLIGLTLVLVALMAVLEMRQARMRRAG